MITALAKALGYDVVAGRDEIAETRRGRGLATAATRAMLAEALADERVTTVIAHTLPERNASNRVLEKAGFRFEGEAHEDDEPRLALLAHPCGERCVSVEAARRRRPGLRCGSGVEPPGDRVAGRCLARHAGDRDDVGVTLLVIVLVAGAVVWISRWDLRRPDAVVARARHPFARPRPPARRLAGLIVAAIAICLLTLAVLPYLDRFRFP